MNKTKSKSTSGNMIHSVGQIFDQTKWNLMPFYLSIIIYVLFHVPMEQQNLFGMVLKCLPIFALIHFVWQNGLEHTFNKTIFVALLFSCAGDAFLDFPDYFPHGTASFAISQILTIYAFGFQPLKLSLGLKTFGMMGISLPLVLPKILQSPSVLLMLVLSYTPCLMTMVWRAIARVGFGTKSFSSLRMLTCIGAISFGLSDTAVALNKFYAPFPHAQGIIMTTYYLAQFAIALSVLEYRQPAIVAKGTMNGKSG